jgi:hypothetical protein
VAPLRLDDESELCAKPGKTGESVRPVRLIFDGSGKSSNSRGFCLIGKSAPAGKVEGELALVG